MDKLSPELQEDFKRPFQKGDMKHPLQEESSFAVLFPHYREKYLTENWSKIEEKLDSYGIKCYMDSKDGVLSVTTTDKTWDPVSIILARDFIRLLARSVPVEQAFRVFEDGIESMISVIGRDIRNQDRFIKRRQRLVGPNGSTLKALELLTNCYILVQGHTVAAIGPPEGLSKVQEVANDCMHNIHPVYHIKRLMVIRQLKRRPELANEDWDQYLPKFKKVSQKKNKSTKKDDQEMPKKEKKSKKERGGLPDFPKDTELDRQIETGEYFLKKRGNDRKKYLKDKKKRQGAVETTSEPQTANEETSEKKTASQLADEIVAKQQTK